MTVDVRLTEAQMAAFDAIPNDQVSGIKPAFEKLSVERYLDPAIFEQEKEAIFLNLPMPLAASAQLPGPDTFLRQDIAGKSVLLTRDKGGVARAFVNTCRHRGVTLCPSHELQTGKLVVCPYHAWGYAMDGALTGVPRAEIFSALNKDEYGLSALPCAEGGGMIWVGLRPEGRYDFSVETGQLARELRGIHLDQARHFKTKAFTVKANWKLLMDTTLDSYHVTRLHRNTVASMFSDSPVIVEPVGLHLRNASARGNFAREDLSDKVAMLRKVAVVTYQLFPAATVILSPHYTSVEMFRPISHNETRVEFVMLTQHPQSAEVDERLQRSFDFMCRVFGEEDFWAAELGQEGISSGDLKELTLGGMENQMRTFHGMVDQQINKYYQKA